MCIFADVKLKKLTHYIMDGLEKYIREQLQKQAELANLSTEKQESFVRHILLVSSSIFGILIALHGSAEYSLYTRLIFVLSMALLTLGTLCSAIVLYDLTHIVERAHQDHNKECKDALQERRAVKPVFVHKKKRTEVFEKMTYLFLICSVILLSLYSILPAF
jgi:hypothetical protein